MVLKAPAPHDHGVGRGHFARPLGSARSPRVLHAPGVASGGGGKPGRRWLGQRVNQLLEHEQERLLKVLKKHQAAIGYTLDDLKGH